MSGGAEATATVRHGDLATAVKWAATAIASKPGLPVLAAMPVTLEDGMVTIAARMTGLAQAITIGTAGGGDGYAVVLADGRALARAVRGLRGRADTPVTVAVTFTGVLELAASGVTVTVAASGPDQEFPPMPLVTGPAGAACDPDAFRVAASTAARCASSSCWPDTPGVWLAANRGVLGVTGIDRTHLFHAVTEWDGPDLAPVRVPAAAVAAFASASDGTTPVVIRAELGDSDVIPIRRNAPPPPKVKWPSGPWTQLQDASHLVAARGAESKHDYPDVAMVIRPAALDTTTITISAAGFAAAVRRTAEITGKRGDIRVATTDGAVTVHAVDGATNGDASTQHLPAEVTGPPAVVHLIACDLADILSAASGDVQIGIAADHVTESGHQVPSPATLRGGNWTGVIQPQRNPRHLAAGRPTTSARLASVKSLPAGE